MIVYFADVPLNITENIVYILRTYGTISQFVSIHISLKTWPISPNDVYVILNPILDEKYHNLSNITGIIEN